MHQHLSSAVACDCIGVISIDEGITTKCCQFAYHSEPTKHALQPNVWSLL